MGYAPAELSRAMPSTELRRTICWYHAHSGTEPRTQWKHTLPDAHYKYGVKKPDSPVRAPYLGSRV
eukprot:1438624-Rhodomonas_salina.1